MKLVRLEWGVSRLSARNTGHFPSQRRMPPGAAPLCIRPWHVWLLTQQDRAARCTALPGGTWCHWV